jgi:hypothetical protein
MEGWRPGVRLLVGAARWRGTVFLQLTLAGGVPLAVRPVALPGRSEAGARFCLRLRFRYIFRWAAHG